MSNDNHIVAEMFLYIFHYLIDRWCCEEVFLFDIGEVWYCLAEFTCISPRIDVWAEVINNFTIMVYLYDTDLDDEVFIFIKSGGFEVETDMSIVFV